jgi:hypothetical protein
MDEVSKKKLEEIMAKGADELSTEEAGFLKARRSYLPPGYDDKFASILKPTKKPGRQKKK